MKKHPLLRSVPSPRTAAVLLSKAGVLVALAGVATGCSTVRSWFADDESKPTEPNALVDFAPSLNVAPLWSEKVGGGEEGLGIGQGPVVDSGRVYAAAV